MSAPAPPIRWQKLSPEEFRQLQEYAKYSNKKLKHVVNVFEEDGELHGLVQVDPESDGEEQLIDLNCFRKFLDMYLECDVDDDLSEHLFASFIRKRGDDSTNCVEEPAITIPPLRSGHSGLDARVNERLNEIRQSICDKLPALKLRYDTHKPLPPAHSNVDISDSALHVETVSTRSLDNDNTIDEIGHQDSPSSCGSPTKRTANWPALNATADDSVSGTLVPIKDIVCYLSLLEGGRPEDKLEFMFRLYDTDDSGYLDQREMLSIIDQMMSVANYLGWDTKELRPILHEMMDEIDFDKDGTVSLDEWQRGGLTTIPLLVLLGFETNVKEDGAHLWQLKHFNRPAYCNLCLSRLAGGFGRQGLRCSLCKYTAHERCVKRAPNNCIHTYVKSIKTDQAMPHHWVEGNCMGKCGKCRKAVKGVGLTGIHCRWCQVTLHNKCATNWTQECKLGPLAYHILPPTSICPVVLDRQKVERRESRKESQARAAATKSQPTSFHISPLPSSRPLLVFVNPKSGGKQGERLYRKFQYLLNPRQVYDLTTGGPYAGLTLFAEIENMNILCCGGDGTVGWVLDSMDKMEFEKQPPVAILPLGTGNDLARCLNWGGGYDGEDLVAIMQRIQAARTVMMDRWEISLTEFQSDQPSPTGGDPMPYNIINNYFSIGVDASIARRFHLMREKHPEKFKSRTRNKLIYFEYGTSETLKATCKNLHEHLDIICDGEPVDLANGPALESISLLNIPSIYGGSNLWGMSTKRSKKDKRAKATTSLPLSLTNDDDDDDAKPIGGSQDLSKRVQDMSDKLIEVVGLENAMHAGQVKAGIRSSGRRLAQCSSILIRTRRRFPMQIDGEPWLQPPCTITITHKNQVPVLMGPVQKRRNLFVSLFNKHGSPPHDDDHDP